MRDSNREEEELKGRTKEYRERKKRDE